MLKRRGYSLRLRSIIQAALFSRLLAFKSSLDLWHIRRIRSRRVLVNPRFRSCFVAGNNCSEKPNQMKDSSSTPPFQILRPMELLTSRRLTLRLQVSRRFQLLRLIATIISREWLYRIYTILDFVSCPPRFDSNSSPHSLLILLKCIQYTLQPAVLHTPFSLDNSGFRFPWA